MRYFSKPTTGFCYCLQQARNASQLDKNNSLGLACRKKGSRLDKIAAGLYRRTSVCQREKKCYLHALAKQVLATLTAYMSPPPPRTCVYFVAAYSEPWPLHTVWFLWIPLRYPGRQSTSCAARANPDADRTTLNPQIGSGTLIPALISVFVL